MADEISSPPPASYWLISVIALLWNLVGVMSYVMQVTMTPETLAEMPDADRILYAAFPAWATAAFAIAVFAGTLGCIGLLLRQSFAIAAFVLSLLGVLVQQTYAFGMTDLVAIKGPSSIVLPALVTIIAVYLIFFARAAARKGVLR